MLADVRVRLPIDVDMVNYAYIERETNQMPGFAQLLEMLHAQAQDETPPGSA